MMKPTQEQRQEFWEKCGLGKRVKTTNKELCTDGKSHLAYYNDRDQNAKGKLLCMYCNEELGYPPINLNNLFKYAVPKVSETHAIFIKKWVDTDEWLVELAGATLNYRSTTSTDKDPALALFWAIWEVG